MSYLNGNYPSQGTHFSDGVRVGQVFTGAGKTAIINSNIAELDGPYGYSQGAPGAPISPRFLYALTPPIVSATSLFPNTVTTGAGYVTLVATPGITTPAIVNGENVLQFRYPTCVEINFLNNIVSDHVLVWGYDYGNVPMMEAVAVAGSNTGVFGFKAFKSISHIYVPSANTWSGGDSNQYGLPYYVGNFGDIASSYWNQIVLASSNFVPGDLTYPATATTGDPRGLIIPPAPDPSGTINLIVDMYVQGAQGENQTVAGLYGVPQYTQPLT